MYVGRFQRNADIQGNALIMSDFIFQRMDEQTYNDNLKEQYEKYLQRTGRSFFQGQIDEAFETNQRGDLIVISAQDLEDHEDELVRLMHDKFMNGEDTDYFNYKEDIDENEEYDDVKQIELDQEEQWFEKDNEEINGEDNVQNKDPQSTIYTGILDY
ncbi:UNKNOWN [Stylonychia lemnae]|uniref:CCD97-like C-terminal domain-containing protein n=1 Tax=Stylonychia lemnae TaxID=5949 RepID=A0A078A2F4_STYLE|nr:UNKNOWN [Stylonychia lemnae]|eukprot:CDW75997.1 UNKNOWN [Stylonychia lemnae]